VDGDAAGLTSRQVGPLGNTGVHSQILIRVT
jgi:hypothetical protein